MYLTVTTFLNLNFIKVTQYSKRRRWFEILCGFWNILVYDQLLLHSDQSRIFPDLKMVKICDSAPFQLPDGKVPELNHVFVSFSSFVIFHLPANKKLLDTGGVPWCSSVQNPHFVHLIFLPTASHRKYFAQCHTIKIGLKLKQCHRHRFNYDKGRVGG